MIHHYKGCTVCNLHCRSGWSQLCQETPVTVYGNNGHGGHAAYMKVPAFTVVPPPRRIVVHDRRGCLVRHRDGLRGASAHPAFRQRHDRDLRPGAGRFVGDAACRRDGGARDRARRQRGAAQPRQGVPAPPSSSTQRSNDPVGAIKDLTHGYGADFTLDTSSQPEGRIAAVRGTKVWGTTCFVGERNKVEIDVSPDMLRKQLTIVASWTFSSIRPGRMRPIRRRPQHIRRRRPLHPPLEPRPGRRGPTESSSTRRRPGKACF